MSLSSPDEKQREAITASLNPSIMVIAGPGAGKSRVLSSRLAHLLLREKCKPHQILVLSFTHNAAKSLRTKAEKMLVNSVNSPYSVESTISSSGVYCDTFHGFCSVVLKNHGHLLNLEYDLKIADEFEQLKIMTSLLKIRGYKSSNAAMATNLLRRIRFWKESGLGYLGVQQEFLKSWTEKRAYEIYPIYQRELRSRSAIDFGDLLLFTLRLFRENRHILETYRNKYNHILVDEFQDISPAQYDILRILVVGFLDKAVLFSNSDDESYVMSGFRKTTLSTEKLENGSDVDHKISNFATLSPSVVRKNLNSLSFESSFEQDSGDRYNTDLNTLLRTKHEVIRKRVNVFCAGDDDQSIYGFRGSHIELMRRFRFDFPNAKVLKFDTSYRMPKSLCQITKSVIDPLPDRISKVLNDEIGRIETGPSLEIKRFSDENCELEWISLYLENELKDERGGSVAILGRTQKDVQKIATSLRKKRIMFSLKTTAFDSMSQLMSSTISNCISEGISLMTMHAAKGLEFNKVILPFWVDGNVPYVQQYNYNPNDERRLAFVSLTRARLKVMITFSKFSSSNYKQSLRTKNEPSLYIEELVKKNQTISINFEDLCMYHIDKIKNGRTNFFSAQNDDRCVGYSKLGVKNPMICTETVLQVLLDAMNTTCIENEILAEASRIMNTRNDFITNSQQNLFAEPGNVQHLSNTSNEIDEIDSIFLKSLDDLDLEDVKKLMNNKLVKKKALKDLFIKKIRHMKSLKRMSIPVSISCGKDVKKPLSKCNANEAGQYLLRHLDQYKL